MSLNDDVTYTDLGEALQLAWRRLDHHDRPRSYDIAVHSTGALVVRDWMTRRYIPATVPIKHFLQLAPANFGSPLAHKGRSILGRIVKGGISNRFQTGTHLLKGLELAAPYTWQLAQRHLFFEESWYGPGRILASVFVGLKTYSGLAGAFASDGSDGTVRVSTANLRATHITLDMRAPFSVTVQEAPSTISMLPVDRFDHSSIVTSEIPSLLEHFSASLSTDDDDWTNWCEQSEIQHREIIQTQHASRDEHRHAYQNTVMRVRDECGQLVPDYLLEVELADSDTGFFSQFFQSDAIRDVHVNKANSSYRSLFVDVSEWKKRIDKADEAVKFIVTASPEYRAREPLGNARGPADKSQFSVGFEPKSFIGQQGELDRYFAPNRTALIDVVLPRRIGPQIVWINSLEETQNEYGD